MAVTSNKEEEKQPQKTSYYTLRFLLMGLLLLIALGAVGFKMFMLAVNGQELRRAASERMIQEREVPARLGNIYSSDGYLMAATVQRYNIYWDAVLPKQDLFDENVEPLSRKLASIFPSRTAREWKSYLTRGRANKNRYLRIASLVLQSQRDSVRTFPIFCEGKFRSGLIIESQTDRVRPMEGISDRLIGVADENKGFVGIEGSFVNIIKGEPGRRIMQKIQNEWKPLFDENSIDPIDGKDLYLTINFALQEATQRFLREQLERYEADHGCAIVMEVKTGKLRALVNLSHTPNGYADIQNFAVGELNDPGSTFKLASVLAAMEDGVIDTAQVVDTDGGIYQVYNARVRDSHAGGYGKISLRQGFVRSSNTAIVKTIYPAYKDHPADFVNRLLKMNIGEKTGVRIVGEPAPEVPMPGKPGWSGLSMPWMSYGYEIRLTPLQILTFYNAVANEGRYMRSLIVERMTGPGGKPEHTAPEEVSVIASAENIKQMKDMMMHVVLDKNGTAHNICDSLLRMAGKTGTAQYGYGRGEKVRYIASFAGYFPYEDPKYSVMVMVHQPKSFSIYGGTLAAPVARRIAYEIYRTTPMEFGFFRQDEKAVEQDIAVSSKPVIFEVGQTLPNMRGMFPGDVVPVLENKGIVVRISGGMGKITSQSLLPGTRVKKGMELTLTTSL